MKRLLILGGGTAGTMAANKLRKALSAADWTVTVVDADDDHRYQPGYLFMPFGTYQPDQVTKSRRKYLRKGVDLVYGEVDVVKAADNQVQLTNGQTLPYDMLIIATGVQPRPDQTPGMMDAPGWRDTVHEFYSYEGSVALAEKLKNWPGGRLVVHVVDMPIKCPVAPLEFAFLADDYFKQKGIRDKVEMTYVTPLDGAFTKPIAAQAFGSMLQDKGIDVVPDFMVESVDSEAGKLIHFDESEVPFDLLVTVPLNMGAEFIARSGLGNDLNLVPVDKHTQLSTSHDNIFALGDANDTPTSKAGSVAHFEVDLFVENFLDHIAGKPMKNQFDGHANCFIETGEGKAMLIDFNYDTQPLPGKFPYAGIGPMNLLKATRANHLGKLAFRWVYWNILLPGRPLPIAANMSLAGKQTELLETAKA